MCLAEVFLTKKDASGKTAKRNGVFYGFKSLVEFNGGDKHGSDYFSAKTNDNSWHDADNQVLSIGGKSYTSGFHIFLDVNDALNYHGDIKYIHLVEFTNIVAIGKQYSSDKGLTVIAKKMRVVRKAVKGKDY